MIQTLVLMMKHMYLTMLGVLVVCMTISSTRKGYAQRENLELEAWTKVFRIEAKENVLICKNP